jgi:aconitase A
MSWLDALDVWINSLDPLAFMVYVMSPPLLVAAAFASYIKWRDDHRPPQSGHPAE